MGPSFRWQDIYSRNLFRHGRGYALPNPEPSRTDSPYSENVYAEGIRVGDVGLITDPGSFITLFNIFQTSEAPVNQVYGVPQGFQPLECRRSHRHSDLKYYPTNTRIYSNKTQEVTLDASGEPLPGVPFGPGLGIGFQFSRSQGAVLLLQEGADRVDYLGLPDIRAYAESNAESWYRFLVDEVRMDAYNGCLYLVTGYDRTNCYENLSFESSSKAASVSFRFSSPVLPNGNIGRLGFSYSSLPCNEHRRGASRPEHTLHNLTPFIRGFKIMLRQSLTRLKSPIKVMDIDKTDFKNVIYRGTLPAQFNNYASGSGLRSSLASPTSASPPSSSSKSASCSDLSLSPQDDSISPWDCDSDTEEDSESSFSERGSSILSSDSESADDAANCLYHPADIINEHMLKYFPDARVALIHDEEWISVLDNLDDRDDFPDDNSLLNLIREKFRIKHRQGTVQLAERKDELQVDEQQKTKLSKLTSVVKSLPRLHISTHPQTVPLREPQKRALLVGISYNNSLTGPHKDVKDMKTLLIEKYGYKPNNIITLLDTDEQKRNLQPTKGNLLRELKDLLVDSQSGDHFCFYYTGHVIQGPADNNKEEDNIEEYIVPCDADIDSKKYDDFIQDDKLRELLVDPLPVGAHLVAIFDSCHSGTLLDLEHHRCNRVYLPWYSKVRRSNDSLWNNVRHRPAAPFHTRPALSKLKSYISQFQVKSSTLPSSDHSIGIHPSMSGDSSCDGRCQPPKEEHREIHQRGGEVIALSACRDDQVSWEDKDGNSILIHALWKRVHPSFQYFMTKISNELHRTGVSMHDDIRKYMGDSNNGTKLMNLKEKAMQ